MNIKNIREKLRDYFGLYNTIPKINNYKSIELWAF